MRHLLFVLLLCGVAAAEPSPTVKYLMNEPLTLWDFGMWRLTESMKEFKLESYSPFSRRDFRDWPDFVSKLTRAKNADRPSPGKRIWALLPPSTQGILQFRVSTKFTHEILTDSLENTKYMSNIYNEYEDQSNIIDGLNKILDRRDFYQEDDFSGVNFPDEVLDLLSRKREELSKKKVQKLNRLLLATAYPYNIEKSNLEALFHIKAATYDLEENRIEIFVEDSVPRQTVQEAKIACKNIITNLQRMFGILSHTGNPPSGRRSSVIGDYFSHQGFQNSGEPNDLDERLDEIDEMVELTALVSGQIMCQCKLRSTEILFRPDTL